MLTNPSLFSLEPSFGRVDEVKSRDESQNSRRNINVEINRPKIDRTSASFYVNKPPVTHTLLVNEDDDDDECCN